MFYLHARLLFLCLHPSWQASSVKYGTTTSPCQFNISWEDLSVWYFLMKCVLNCYPQYVCLSVWQCVSRLLLLVGLFSRYIRCSNFSCTRVQYHHQTWQPETCPLDWLVIVNPILDDVLLDLEYSVHFCFERRREINTGVLLNEAKVSLWKGQTFTHLYSLYTHPLPTVVTEWYSLLLFLLLKSIFFIRHTDKSASQEMVLLPQTPCRKCVVVKIKGSGSHHRVISFFRTLDRPFALCACAEGIFIPMLIVSSVMYWYSFGWLAASTE